jgi:trans-aconitate methyltransferase
MSQELFDEASNYEEMLNRGLRLSGENKTFFMEGRLQCLRSQLPPDYSPAEILDFGCGTGETSTRLLQSFDGAHVVGIDVSAGALEHARQHHGSTDISFFDVDSFEAPASFDLCYSNGAFHHIEPAQRPRVLSRLRELLRPGGLLAVFENNPWNPGTRLIMRRIPFDKDAQTVDAVRMRRLVAAAGFELVGPARYMFVFPKPLKALRVAEPRLDRLPLGAQYLVLARRPLS